LPVQVPEDLLLFKRGDVAWSWFGSVLMVVSQCSPKG
jgi:hypothetical protein